MRQALFLFRPEPGWSESAKRARDMGLEVAGNPLFTIAPCAWKAPESAGFDAILAGSANAFRHGGTQLSGLAALPVLAVGEATAQAARDAGFTVASVGEGGLQALVDALPREERALLRLSGEKRVDLALPEHVTAEERVVYRAEPQELSQTTAHMIQSGGVAALHSAEAARRFSAEAGRLELDRSAISLLLIGPRLLQEVGEGWKSVHLASTPSDAALLALACDVCNQGSSDLE